MQIENIKSIYEILFFSNEIVNVIFFRNVNILNLIFITICS